MAFRRASKVVVVAGSTTAATCPIVMQTFRVQYAKLNSCVLSLVM